VAAPVGDLVAVLIAISAFGFKTHAQYLPPGWGSHNEGAYDRRPPLRHDARVGELRTPFHRFETNGTALRMRTRATVSPSIRSGKIKSKIKKGVFFRVLIGIGLRSFATATFLGGWVRRVCW
jgi:hypothetical protein